MVFASTPPCYADYVPFEIDSVLVFVDSPTRIAQQVILAPPYDGATEICGCAALRGAALTDLEQWC